MMFHAVSEPGTPGTKPATTTLGNAVAERAMGVTLRPNSWRLY